jgi:hypothetical protein
VQTCENKAGVATPGEVQTCENKAGVATPGEVQALDTRLSYVFWWSRLYANNVCTFVMNLSQVAGSKIAALTADVEKLGGSIVEVLAEKQFNPEMVLAGAAQQGFYKQLHELQGVRDTYFTGQNVCCSFLIEDLLEYNQNLVQTYF